VIKPDRREDPTMDACRGRLSRRDFTAKLLTGTAIAVLPTV
jgi:hypothetical protein